MTPVSNISRATKTSPILSTPIIPLSPSWPKPTKRRDTDETSEGSRLDAKNTTQGVIIASEFTTGDHRDRDRRHNTLAHPRGCARDAPASPVN